MTDPSATSYPTESHWVPAGAPPPQLSRRRHHRFLTLPSSALIVICMFLPIVEVCGKPMYPVEFPPIWTPYVIAVLVFVAAMIRPHRLYALVLGIRLVFGITATIFCLWAVDELAPEPITLLPIAILALSLAIVVIKARTHELMAARVGAVSSAAGAIWFGMISTDPDALFGAQVSVLATIALAIGCVWWWIEAYADSR
jgi:hypothetical protein